MTETIHDKGDHIGERYEILKYVGEGGMQEVYLAKDRLLSRPVALKAPKSASARKRFQRSAIVSARVNHANVAKTLDYVETKERPYLIEEFIQGRDLGNVLAVSFPCIDPYLAARIFHHLAKGLAASHHVGVVHRDLKPSNVMVAGGERFLAIKITDFGIAKMAKEELADAVEGGDEKSLTASKTALGALPYMAPEAIESLRHAGKASDVWSLGAMMFEIISGQKPFGFGFKAVPAILDAKPPKEPKVLRSKAQFRPLGGQIFELILRCLSRDPDARPTAVQLVNECEGLCYSLVPREFGRVSRFDNSSWGFISADEGKNIFFHVESLYGDQSLKVGDTVSFSRHPGGGADRAFPLIKLKAHPA